MTGPVKLLGMLVHGKKAEDVPSESTDASVLAALEWSDVDSGEDLVRRAEELQTNSQQQAEAAEATKVRE
jgi:hypothetical protein